MPWEAWFTLAVVAATVAVLATDRVPPALAMLAAVVTLLVTGVVDEGQAFSGFANPAPITVAALYVLAGAAEATGALEWLSERVLDGGRGERRRLARLTYPVAGASGLLSNTPLVAMLAPRVVVWARRTGRSPSRYLLPLSYASILGGTLTVLGTSTNLVVSGLLEADGRPPLGLFEITVVGVPLAVLGCTALVVAGPRLLPDRRAPTDQLAERAREYTVEMVVAHEGPVAGSTVAAAGLRNLEGVYLVDIERQGHTLGNPRPDHLLEVGDHLTFAGNLGRVLDLQRMPGLRPAEERHFSVAGPGRQAFEAVVAEGSALAGSTLREVGFRSRYGAGVLAVHRAGTRVTAKLGEVRLRPGDVLLVVAGPDFHDRWRQHHDFLAVAPLDGHGPPPRRERARTVELVVLGLVVLAGTGLLPVFHAALLAALAVVALRVVSADEARRAVDLDTVVLIAASFGVGAAVATSGLAEVLGDGLVGAADRFGPVALLAAVLLATMALTELLSNNAAAVLVFPVALAAAAQAGLDPRPFAIAIAVGASSSFLTPIGYQTNTMVLSMGGYRFGDFARLGWVTSIVAVAVTLTVVPLAWDL